MRNLLTALFAIFAVAANAAEPSLVWYDGDTGNLLSITNGLANTNVIGQGSSTQVFNNVTLGNVAVTNDFYLTNGAEVTQYIWLPASALKAKPSGGAVYGDRGDFAAFEFDDGQDRYIESAVKIPSGIKHSDGMTFCVGWESDTTSQTSVWELTIGVHAAGEDITTATAVYTNSFVSSGTSKGLVVSQCCTSTVATNDVCIKIKLMRDGNNAGDTLGASAWVHGIAAGYTVQRLGE